MKSKWISSVVAGMVLLGLIVATSNQVQAQNQPSSSSVVSTTMSATSKGLDAMNTAAQTGKYQFFLFWKENNQQTQAMNGVLQAAMQKWTQSANAMAVQIDDPTEKPLIDKYGLSRAPMPLVLAIAPNGAITGGFPIKCTEQELQEAFVSPCSAQCLKCLQDRKLVLLCVQGEKTENNQAALQGVQSFKNDEKYAKTAEIVMLNPENSTETSFLQELKVDPRTTQAVTVFIAPPGQPLATFAGPVTKEQIVAKLTSASSGCCPGGKCGPGGCGPKK